MNTRQVYECVNESLCALCGEAKQSQKCNHGVKSSEREQEKSKEGEKREIEKYGETEQMPLNLSNEPVCTMHCPTTSVPSAGSFITFVKSNGIMKRKTVAIIWRDILFYAIALMGFSTSSSNT